MNRFGDDWIGAVGTSGNRVQVTRCRRILGEMAVAKTHPRLLRIIWRYEADDPSGLPSVNLNEKMASFENAIFDELQKDSVAIFVCVCVADGIKEWLAYISDAQRACNRLNEALESHEPYPVELSVEDDPNWREYKAIRSRLETKEGGQRP
jgi:Family of unknown function (DUF695)